MDPWGRGFLVSAVMQSTPASMTGIVILHSILQKESDALIYLRILNIIKTLLTHERNLKLINTEPGVTLIQAAGVDTQQGCNYQHIIMSAIV